MNIKELIEQIQNLIPRRDFKSINVLFFDFVYHRLEIEKPSPSNWQKIRDLLLSNQENQQLALQILEGQGLQAFGRQIMRIQAGDFFKYFQERLEWVSTTIAEEETFYGNYQQLKLELEHTNQSLSLKGLNEKEKKIKKQRKKEIEERMNEYQERMLPLASEVNSVEEGMKHVKNALQYFFKRDAINNQALSFYEFLFICNHATAP